MIFIQSRFNVRSEVPSTGSFASFLCSFSLSTFSSLHRFVFRNRAKFIKIKQSCHYKSFFVYRILMFFFILFFICLLYVYEAFHPYALNLNLLDIFAPPYFMLISKHRVGRLLAEKQKCKKKHISMRSYITFKLLIMISVYGCC